MTRSLDKKHLIFPAIFLLLASSCRTKEKWHTSSLLYFDTICDVQLWCSPSLFKEAQEEVVRAFSEIEKNFSPGAKEYSSPLVVELFQKARDISLRSDGSFDITVGPFSRLWGFIDKEYRIPSLIEVRDCLKNVGMDTVSEREGMLILPPGTELDWGGIAKGWGVDLAARALVKNGITRGFVNAGGDLSCWGENPDNGLWRVGIKHPRKSGFLGVVLVSGLSVATSGDYQRYFERNGVRYHHIFNPKTGYPARGKQSVTVVGPEAFVCDALSTALFVSPQPEKILEKYPDYGAILVDGEGKVSFLGRSISFELF